MRLSKRRKELCYVRHVHTYDVITSFWCDDRQQKMQHCPVTLVVRWVAILGTVTRALPRAPMYLSYIYYKTHKNKRLEKGQGRVGYVGRLG